MSVPAARMPGGGQGRTAELYGQLIPLDGDTLLLPNAAVVEVRSMDDVSLRGEPPGWLLGFLRWREHELPVVSLEGLLGRPLPARSRRSRLLVVNSFGSHLTVGLFALVCQGYPHLTALNHSALQAMPLEARDPDALVLARVRVANTSAVIPDLEALELRLAPLLTPAARAAGEPLQDWQPQEE